MTSSPNIGDDHRHRLDRPDDLIVVEGALIAGKMRVGSVLLEDEVRSILIIDGWRNNDDLPEASETIVISSDAARTLGESLIKAADSSTALAAEVEAESVRQGAIAALEGDR